MFVARAIGAFERAGLEVEFACADPFRGDALAHLERGEVDFGLSYPNRLMARVAEGASLKSVAATCARPMESVCTLSSRPIRRAKDLQGLRVGYRRSARMTALLNHLVRQDDGDPSLVRHVELYPAEPMPADLRDDKLDAMFGALWAWEGLHGPVELGLEMCHVEVDQLGAPPYNAQVLAARSDVDQQLQQAVVTAIREGAERSHEHPDHALDVMVEAAPYFSPNLHRASLAWVSQNWGLPGTWGAHDHSALAEYHRWLREAGLVSADVNLTSIFEDPAA